MDTQDDKNKNIDKKSNDGLRNWEAPKLSVSSIETITEGGTLIADDQEDAFYTS